jgi:hypothetical protein
MSEVRVMSRRRASLLALVLSASAGVAAELPEAASHLADRGVPPVDYVASKFEAHEVVLLGEGHWVRHDVELVRDLVRVHGGRAFGVLASELYPASEQATIDRVTAAETWDEAAAMSVLRASAWPYRQYLDVLREAWAANRDGSGRHLRVLALGPGEDWRERLLPRGETYETFMAGLVAGQVGDPASRVLVHVGFHHAFTRYYQPDQWRGQRVTRFMDRMGNLLWRQLGQQVFMVALHPPFLCRDDEEFSTCPPVEGAIDCAADAAGGRPVGFDVAASPFAALSVRAHYATGYPDLRLVDLADGWVWQARPDALRLVDLIPLEAFAPDDAALAEVLAHNPFSDEPGLTVEDLPRLWTEEAARLADVAQRWPWVRQWRAACTAPR